MTTASPQGRAPRPRAPSASGYMVAAGATAATLFFTLWWMLHSGGDDSPWVPAGLAASVVLLVAVAAREAVMRRAWTRYMLEHDRRGRSTGQAGARRESGSRKVGLEDSNSRALRALQRQCAEADAPGALPEAHLEAYLSCQEYLEGTNEKLRSASVVHETRIALRAGQERARTLARHHLINWARGASRSLTHEAQRRVRVSDKVETAQRALDVLASALKLYPEEAELHESEKAVHEFIASVKISRWVEMAERAAFKGYYGRAIDRYRDALFYLSRESLSEESRAATAERIGREIEMLRARRETHKITLDVQPEKTRKRTRRKSGE